MIDLKDRAAVSAVPLPLQVMMERQWDQAFDSLFLVTSKHVHDLVDGCLARTKASDDRERTRRMINDLIDRLYERKRVALALSWSFLAADPAQPETIQVFLPQVSALFDQAVDDGVYTGERYELVRETLNVWTEAAAGEYTDSKLSVFAVAAKLERGSVTGVARMDQWRLTVADASGGSCAIFIHGQPANDRFKVSILKYKGGWRVLWIDRRWRFVLTRHRLWNLGERGSDAT